MIASMGLVCLAISLAQNANLLANASFEEISPDGRPAHWSAFVMPQDGAFAEADPLALEGARAAMLHIPNPYEREPANNWSQIVLADVAGKQLVFTGNIRTEAAGEAALWLQCFTKSPARVTAAATSTAEGRFAGTNDWTPVEVRLMAPANVDFVVVRCVLKGQGSAWFDELRLEVAQEEQPELPVFEPETGPIETAPPGETLHEPDLLEVSRMLNQAIAELEANNSRILERVQRIQQELDQTKGSERQELAPLEKRHPLVPHGWKPEGETR